MTNRTGRRCELKLIWVLITIAIFSCNAGAINVSTDYRNLNAGPTDFGGSSHFLGGPVGDAVITYDYNTSSGEFIATGRVQGTLYWDDLFRSGCTRLTLRFRNDQDVNLAVRTATVCGNGGDANNSSNKIQVDEAFASTTLFYIVITVNELSGGQLIGGTSTTVHAPVERQFNFTLTTSWVTYGGTVPANVSFTRFQQGLGAHTGGTLGSSNPILCARLIVDFRTINAAILQSNTREACFFGAISASADAFDHALFQVKLRLGELNRGVFQNPVSLIFNFNGVTGNFVVDPEKAVVPVHQLLNYGFTWTVPEPLNWHHLESLQLRIKDDQETILWVRFNEATNTFNVFNEATGRFGPDFEVGNAAQLQSPHAALHLSEAKVAAVNSVLGTGPTSPSVRFNLPLSFKPSAAGRTYHVEVAARDDLGNEDPFTVAGTLTVTR
jgi:hypothetical protein